MGRPAPSQLNELAHAAGPGKQRGLRDGAQVLREEPGWADPRPVQGAGPAHRLRQHREPGVQGGQSRLKG